MKPGDTLPTQRHCISVKPMPQRPKNLKIARVDVHPDARTGKVRVGPAAAVPARFTADVQLETPDVWVRVVVSVASGGQPAVTQLTVWPGPKVALTSGTLRQVLIDPILQAAMATAAVPVEDRPDVAPGAFHVEGEPEHQLWVSTPAGATDRVLQIARLYNDAVTAGSRSPGLVAAEAVHISRAQASRYIKRGRDLGLIPPVGEALAPVPPEASANGATGERPDPGPSIFRDPAAPLTRPGADQ